MKSWTITVEENPDNPEELILPFPEDFLKETGWAEGDTLEWIDNKNGTWSLKKLEVTNGK